VNLPPVSLRPSEYTDDERAVIAGYLLRQRSWTLQALASSDRMAEISTDYGRVNQQRYYQACEQYSRLLLYRIGYAVEKKGMYGQPAGV